MAILCSKCVGIFEGARETSDDKLQNYKLQQTGKELQRSAKACRLCWVRWEKVPYGKRSEVSRGTVTVFNIYKDIGFHDDIGTWSVNDFPFPSSRSSHSDRGLNVIIWFEIYFDKGHFDSHSRWLQYWKYDARKRTEPPEWPIARQRIYLVPTSKKVPCSIPVASGCERPVTRFSVINSWLRECTGTHQWCKSTNQHRYSLPTRLLYVGRDHSHPEGFAPPRLCRSDTSPLTDIDTRNIRYATLSHCWGRSAPLVLTKANMDPFTKGIRSSAMPRTFKEALLVARLLRVEYIWIDSLCIIQDCDQDWQAESTMMESVYRNSWCNIAAAYASESRGGLLASRNTPYRRPFSVNATWYNSKVDDWRFGAGVLKAGIFRCYTTHSRSHISEALPNALSKRAWVLQETVLAPRTLYFCSDQVYWECTGFKASGQFPKPLKPELAQSVLHHSLSWRKRSLHLEQRRPYWENIEEQYSALTLKFPSKDKLKALSGMARACSGGDSDVYLAGLWCSELPVALIWCVSEAVAVRPEFQAPTWSWASLNTRIHKPVRAKQLKDCLMVARLVSAEVTKKTKDPFGPVSAGRLSLRAAVFKLPLAMIEDRTKISFDVLSDELKDPGRMLHFAPIVHVETLGQQARCFGLILLLVANRKGCYQRVGSFSLQDAEGLARTNGHYVWERELWSIDKTERAQCVLSEEEYEETSNTFCMGNYHYYIISVI